ncbi:ribonuclease H protein, partial [Trifolium medium]|nr:ribonuclease H protein [Trifolium medium]
MPVKVWNKIVSIQWNFLWGGTSGSKKIPWVGWSDVCRAKELGGLGIKNLRVDQMLRLIVGVKFEQVADSWSCSIAEDGNYTVKACYNFLVLNFLPPSAAASKITYPCKFAAQMCPFCCAGRKLLLLFNATGNRSSFVCDVSSGCSSVGRGLQLAGTDNCVAHD